MAEGRIFIVLRGATGAGQPLSPPPDRPAPNPHLDRNVHLGTLEQVSHLLRSHRSAVLHGRAHGPAPLCPALAPLARAVRRLLCRPLHRAGLVLHCRRRGRHGRARAALGASHASRCCLVFVLSRPSSSSSSSSSAAAALVLPAVQGGSSSGSSIDSSIRAISIRARGGGAHLSERIHGLVCGWVR